MSWGSWTDFVAMGGYALYVWGSYAATVGLIAAEVVLLGLRRRNILEHLGHFVAANERTRHETTV